MKQSDILTLKGLFELYFGEKVDEVGFLPASGSYREYCRLKSMSATAIGAFNADIRENEAFFTFSAHFHRNSIPVPEVFAISPSRTCYLISDLGNTTLFDFLTEKRAASGFSDEIIIEYKKVLAELPRIQVVAGAGIDYSVCYPRAAFDLQSMMWDLNYFKYYFLKLAKIPFDEQALEDDFSVLTSYLLSADSGYFLYRDFQSRNVMLKDGEVFFIDYQGGRRGALQYDLASLLYDGKADIPQNIRAELYEFYLGEIEKYLPVDRHRFDEYFKGFVLIRIMQAMGAYGFRGFYEKKEHFLKSIPYALENLSGLLAGLELPIWIPELKHVLEQVCQSEFLRQIGKTENHLTVNVSSFSYKKGLPVDTSGNGGGFVFDCRAILNPGCIDKYKELTGRDDKVKEFIETKTEMATFLSSVKALVSQSVENYMERGFTSLSVSFGCTGGRHRSVYAAENIAAFVRNKYPVTVVLNHRELV